MFTVLQRYRVRLGSVTDAAVRAEESLVPRLRAVTGFIAYHFLHTGDNTVAALALFDTKAAADVAARLLSEWFRSDWPAFRLLAPDLSVAESLTLEQAEGTVGTALHARQVGSYEDSVLGGATGFEPQGPRDRRRIGERRVLVVAREPERRTGVDRRQSDERRTGSERRGGEMAAEIAAVPAERRRIAPSWRRREAFHAR